MPDPEGRPKMSRTDMEISSLYSVVSGSIRGRDPEFGYDYHLAVAKPLGIMARVLGMRGLNETQIVQRLTAASELAVTVQEHVEARMPEDHDLILN